METLVVTILGLLCTVLAYFLGAFSKKVSGKLMVDQDEPEKLGGVYLSIQRDPKGMKDGERVMLQVVKFSSQGKQRT